MKLIELCQAANAICPQGHEGDEVEAIVTDSRRVCKNSLFVCIHGEQTNGHDHIRAAAEQGAKWALVQEGELIDSTLPMIYLRVADTRRALSYLMDAWCGYPSRHIRLVGVTGTNGKTSICCMIRHILTSCGYSCGIIGTLGSAENGKIERVEGSHSLANMTTPDPEILYPLLARMCLAGVKYAVMEVSSHALVQGRVAPLVFEVGVFTNLTPEHLDYHPSMEAYANAKASLFLQCQQAVINVDSPYADRMLAGAKHAVTCSAKANNTDCVVSDIVFEGSKGSQFQLSFFGETHTAYCPVQGSFSVMNATQAMMTSVLLGVPLCCACKAISKFPGVPGRMERVMLPPDANFTVLIDYAHTPDALSNLLTAVRATDNAKGRIVILFGCGGDRDPTKRPVMGSIATSLADFVILTSDNSRGELPDDILREIISGVDFQTPCLIIRDRADAIAYAIQSAGEGDMILLAGKGHESYEIDRNGRRPFSERDIVLRAYQNKKRM